jgi:Ser/Thr protein kinase RdoA (MazF antagonist)
VSGARHLDPLIAWLPDALDAGQRLNDARPLGGQAGDVWRLDLDGVPVVLKRERPRSGGGEEDLVWEHDFLGRLTAGGFAASRPLPLFAGRSWCRAGGRLWGALSYVPGRPLLWKAAPDLVEAGAFLAAYHGAARSVDLMTQRPTATPLDQLGRMMPWDRLPTATGSVAATQRIEDLVQEMEVRLKAGGYFEMKAVTIHGDFTMDNVLIDGTPPQISGLIDFGSAYREHWAADLVFGLWRSGRAQPTDVALDLDRVRRFLRGYHQQAPIGRGVAPLLPVMLWARGLQLAARWVERAPEPDLPALAPVTTMILRRIDWIRANERDLIAVIGQP